MMRDPRARGPLIAAACAALIVAAIWYPFGFTLGGILEEWGLIGALDAHPGFWNSFPGNPMSDMFAARPLQILPFWLAHRLSAHSFIGFHIVLMAGSFLRIFAGILIGRFIFGRTIYAVLLGILAFVFPADTQQLAFRTLNISTSLALMLAGMAAILTALDCERAARRWLLVALSIATCVVGTLIYEPSITLYAIAPLCVFAREGIRGAFRTIGSRRAEILIWVLAPIINAGYFLYAMYWLKSGYQVQSAEGGMLTGIRHNLHYLVDSLAFRILVDGWVSTEAIFRHIAHWPYLILIGVLVLAGFAIAAFDSTRGRQWRFALRAVVAGTLIAIVAYLPFMVAESHMVITQRTMMAPEFGAAIAFVALLSIAAGSSRIVAVGLAAALVFVGIVAQLYQFDAYNRQYANVIRPYMSMISDRADASRRMHLVFDRTGYAGHLNGMHFSIVHDGPPVRLGNPQAQFLLCLDGPKSIYADGAKCVRNGDTWEITPAYGTTLTLNASDVDVIEVGPEFDNGYRAQKGAWRDDGRFTATQSIFRQRAKDMGRYDCRPDSMWGFSNFCRGNGWSDGIYSKTGMKAASFVVAVVPNPGFVFTMKPAEQHYVLQLATMGAANSDIVQQMKIQVNGHDVAFSLARPDLIEAAINPAYLVDGTNSVTLHNAMLPAFPTGLAVARISLKPAGG